MAKPASRGHARSRRARIDWCKAQLGAGQSLEWCKAALCEKQAGVGYPPLAKAKGKRGKPKRPGRAAVETAEEAAVEFTAEQAPPPEPDAYELYKARLDKAIEAAEDKIAKTPQWNNTFVSNAEKAAAVDGVVTSRTSSEISGPGGGPIRILDEGGLLRNWEMIRRLVNLLRMRAPAVGAQFDALPMEYEEPKQIEEGE